MAEMRFIVEDPDHVHLRTPGQPEGVMVRISPIDPADAVCNAQNSSHTKVPWAFRRGYAAFSKHDYQIAACWFSIGVDADEPASQAFLALLLDSGEGVPQDLKRAFTLAQKSAARGIAAAQMLLADMYKNGHGTPADPEKAQAWLARAQQTQQTAKVDPKIAAGLANGIAVAWDMVTSMMDFDFSMAPPTCFAEDINGSKKPCKQ